MTARRVLSISITEAGRVLASRLPYETTHGDLAQTVRDQWDSVEGFVLCCATGVAVRIIGPLLADKRTDPAVVCVDESGRFAVALSGGHAGGANELATDVAALVGATPVITTASDSTGMVAMDTLPGFIATGDVAAVSRAWLDGAAPIVENDLGWPVPFTSGPGPARVVITDAVRPPDAGVAVLHPPSLVVGVGASTDAAEDAAVLLLAAALADAGLAPEAIGLVATIDRRRDDPVVTTLGHAVRSYPSAELAQVVVPNPSNVVAEAVGTASVAEAAALLAAGEGAELVVSKRKSATATIAIARRARPVGALAVVGLGPGDPRHRTAAATIAVRRAQVVIGYDLYIDQCRDLLRPSQVVVGSPIGSEADRCRDALERSAAGATVALVCSGDPGVFAMATLVHELAPGYGSPPIEVVAGVTAGSAAAALLGAPLAHDHAFISLSDLLTPWSVIERRLRAVAEGDLAVALYNPRSQRRSWQLEAARSILLEHRPPSTPVGIVTDATGINEDVRVTTLADLDAELVGMRTVVVIGSSTTRMVDGHMVTPRGYET